MASNPNEAESSTSTKPFQCTSCQKSYTRKSDLKVHQLTKHLDDELKSYSCKKCLEQNQLPNKFASHCFLNKHIQQVHGPPRFKCQVCFKTFPDSSNFRKHQRIHIQNINKKSYTCEFCLKSFRSKPHFQTHVFNVHKQKPEGLNYLKFEQCSLEFVNKSSLERHVVDKHVVDKNFKCHFCSNTFINQVYLAKHMKRHDTQLKYLCDVCSKGFKQKSSLIHHLEVEHKNLFYCDKCCRPFSHKSDFDQHSDPKTSSELKSEFNCQICDESFDFQCNLDIHINSHINQINVQKVNDDEIGDKTDAKMSTSPKQKLTKELNLEFQCELCSKSYDREAYLKTHLNFFVESKHYIF